MTPAKPEKISSISCGLFSISRGGVISRSTHLIPEAYLPSTCFFQRRLKIKRRKGGKRMNQTSDTAEKMLRIIEKISVKLEKRMSMLI
jgi:hypothetical protein